MRLFAMFDIPVDTKEGKKSYANFRKFLLKDGFIMLQYSVYIRYCHNQTDCLKHILRLKKNKPLYGNVKVLKVTESQYKSMISLIGEKRSQEIIDEDNDTIIIE
ncbi:MAG: CRISPR-associated endonuclease Cas2 [Bacilli bacterium]|nr:CRISPR-associated endonuclease Cas2 [Bacilli bacterium]